VPESGKRSSLLLYGKIMATKSFIVHAPEADRSEFKYPFCKLDCFIIAYYFFPFQENDIA